MTDLPDPAPDAAESRAIELVRLVGSRTATISPGFTTEVVKRARRQRAFAGPARVLGGLLAALAAALADAVRAASGPRRAP
jgi:hypothetical protein